jgi:hypothetical protein
MGWEILSIVGVVVCILLFLGYMIWWPKKEGFQTEPAVVSGTTRIPVAFTCAAGETAIPCPEGSTKCCKVNDSYGAQYVMLRKEDGPMPTMPAPERLGATVTAIDESPTGDAWQAYQDAEDAATEALDAAAPPPAPPPPAFTCAPFAPMACRALGWMAPAGSWCPRSPPPQPWRLGWG